MASKVIDTILNLKDNFSKVINQTTNNTKQFQRQIKMAENQAKSMRESVSSVFTSTAMKIAGAVGVMGIGEFAKSSIELASNLVEVDNVVSTTFGNMTSKINDFASQAGESFGLSELDAKKFTGTLGSMLKTAGFTGNQLTSMSENLTGLAGDISSFYNISQADAFDKLKSGLSGMVEPLRSIGIDISETAVQAYAMSQGFTGNFKTASQATKELYRYQLIMKDTTDVQGDFNKTSGSFANQMRLAKMEIQQFGSNIANYALPSLSGLLQGFNNFIKGINVKDVMENKVIPVFEEIGKVFDTVKSNMKTIMPIISGVIGAFVGFMVIGKVTSEVKNFLKVINNISKLTNPFYLISAGIGLLIAGFVHAYNTSDDFRERVNRLVDKIMGFGDYAGGKLPSLLDNLTSVFTNDLQPALDKISEVAVAIFDYVDDNWGSISTTAEIIGGAVLAWKTALIAVNTSTIVVGATTSIYKTIELAIWGVQNATSAWEAVQWLLNVAMDANPIGLVTLAIAGLGLAIYEVVKHFKEICEWAEKAWEGFKKFIGLGNSSVDVSVNKTTTTTTTDESGNSVQTNTPINANATGTKYWRGGLTKMNEYGGEMAVLPSGSKIIPADKTDKLLNGNSSININLNIAGNVIGNEDFKNEIGQHIFNQVQLAMFNS